MERFPRVDGTGAKWREKTPIYTLAPPSGG